MRRQSFNLLAAVSLLLSLASSVLWVRSYRFSDSETGESVNFSGRDPLWWAVSHRGHVSLCRQSGRDWGTDFGDARLLGFRFGGLRGPSGSLVNLALPYWFLTAMFLSPPAAWLARGRRRRKPSRGLCATCGYDLRASPVQCPECGALVPGRTMPR